MISWKDPLQHAIGQLPIVILIALISPLTAAAGATFFWLGRECGQKRDEFEPGWRGTVQSFLRPFKRVQSAAEWVSPSLAAIIVALVVKWFSA